VHVHVNSEQNEREREGLGEGFYRCGGRDKRASINTRHQGSLKTRLDGLLYSAIKQGNEDGDEGRVGI
jgi:hypothetical protein